MSFHRGGVGAAECGHVGAWHPFRRWTDGLDGLQKLPSQNAVRGLARLHGSQSEATAGPPRLRPGSPGNPRPPLHQTAAGTAAQI